MGENKALQGVLGPPVSTVPTAQLCPSAALWDSPGMVFWQREFMWALLFWNAGERNTDLLCSGRSHFELLLDKCGLDLVKYVQNYWMEALWHSTARRCCSLGGVLLHFPLLPSLPLQGVPSEQTAPGRGCAEMPKPTTRWLTEWGGEPAQAPTAPRQAGVRACPGACGCSAGSISPSVCAGWVLTSS